MLKIKRKKIEEGTAALWDDETAVFLAQSFPQHFAALSANASDLVALSRHARQVGQGFRITKGNQLRRLTVAMVALGANMLDDPRFWPNVHCVLSEYYGDEVMRLDRVAGISQAWARALWEDDTLGDMGARLTQRLRRPNLPFWSYDDVLPQHRGLLTPEIEQQFQRHVHEHIQAIGMPEEMRATAFYLTALGHGIGWWRDPQYINLRRIFETAPTPDAFVSEIDLFYQGFSR